MKTHIRAERPSLLFFVFCFYALIPILSSSEHSAYFKDMFPVFMLQILTLLLYQRIMISKNACVYIGMFISAVISTMFSNYVQFERTIFTYFLLCIITIIFAGFQYSQKELYWFIRFYELYGVLCAILIILSWAFHVEYQWNRYSLDIIGLHKNPNYINNIILLAMAFVIYRIIQKKGNTLINIVYCVVMCVGVFLTATRAAFLCILVMFAFSIIYVLVIKKKYSYIFMFGILIVGAYIILTNFVPEVIKERITGDKMFNDASRLFMWQSALEKFGEHPILGMGLSGITAYNSTISSVEAIHNVILQFVCDQGMIGGILFISLLISIWARVRKEDRLLFLLMIIALYIPIMFQNGTISFTFWWPLSVLEIFANVSARSGIHESRKNTIICINERLQ